MPATKGSAGNVAASAEHKPQLTITRTFNAPRELLYKLFTEPEHIMQWMGPRDFVSRSFTQDARVGGKWRGVLHPVKGGRELWQGGTFLEIVPPSHVSYTFAWDDENGTPGEETIVTIDFEAQGNETKLIFHQTGFTSESERDGHRGGWSETFDKLDEYLASVRRGTAK
jgi:uncharacterized protein YndB with AHSA1/START domain